MATNKAIEGKPKKQYCQNCYVTEDEIKIYCYLAKSDNDKNHNYCISCARAILGHSRANNGHFGHFYTDRKKPTTSVQKTGTPKQPKQFIPWKPQSS